MSQWKGYETYCRGLGFQTNNPIAIASFIEHRTSFGLAFGTIRGDVSAISHHFRHEKSNPTDDSLVELAIRAASKKAPAVKHRKPITRQIILSLAKSADTTKFVEVRDFFLILIAYRAFLRGEEAISLRKDECWSDAFQSLDLPPNFRLPVGCDDRILWITISSSKTNPQKQKLSYDERTVDTRIVGPDVIPEIDPIRWFDRYNALRSKKAEAFFHRSDDFKLNDGFMSPNTFNHIVKSRLAAIGITDVEFGGHSCRAGGATEAARKKVETRLIKRHGRWKSDAVNIYLHDDDVGSVQLNLAIGGFTYPSTNVQNGYDTASAASSSSSSSFSSSGSPQ